jgi:hypothetical protein
MKLHAWLATLTAAAKLLLVSVAIVRLIFERICSAKMNESALKKRDANKTCEIKIS